VSAAKSRVITSIGLMNAVAVVGMLDDVRIDHSKRRDVEYAVKLFMFFFACLFSKRMLEEITCQCDLGAIVPNKLFILLSSEFRGRVSY